MMLLNSNQQKYIKPFCRKKKNSNLKIGSRHIWGCFSLNLAESSRVNAQQFEAVKRAFRRVLSKKVKIWVKSTLNYTVTKKPNETRLGKGKGNVKYWMTIAKIGQSLVEFKGVMPR